MDACMFLTRDACARRVQVSQEMHAWELWFKRAVLVAEFLQGIGLLRRMPYDWGVSSIVSACRNLNMCLIQFVLCSNRTKSILDRAHAFVIGYAAQVQRK